MSDRSTTLTDQFAAQPRVVQWGAIAAVFILGFLVWDSYVRPLADGLRADADAVQRDVQQLSSSGLLDQFRAVSPAVLTMGDIELPESAEDESQKLVQEVNSIVGGFGSRIGSFKLDRRTSVRLRKETMSGFARGKRLEKVVADIEFEATTKDSIDLIRALESSSEIESLSNLRMNKKSGSRDRVEVRLSAEAWGFTAARQ